MKVPDGIPAQAFAKTFADQTIGAIQRRREDWNVERAEVDVAGTPMRRYAWTGVTILAPDGAATRRPARGILLVGASKDFVYALHAQDVDAYAVETVPALEAYLRTFRVKTAQ